jgi:hypothetical protein
LEWAVRNAEDTVEDTGAVTVVDMVIMVIIGNIITTRLLRRRTVEVAAATVTAEAEVETTEAATSTRR